MTLTPGIYADVPEDVYHDDPAEPSLSSSIAKLLIGKSPAHARAAHPKLNPNFKREESDRFDIGTAAHALLLKGEDIIHRCEFKDWRSKDARTMRDEARANGYVPLLADQDDEVRLMVAAFWEQIAGHEAEPRPFINGDAETTLIWEDDDHVFCRARLDWLHRGYGFIDDYKTTHSSADPAAWVKTAYGMGADVQVAFYLRGLERLTGEKAEFRFAVQECSQPYALSVVNLAPGALAYATEKVDVAIQKWRRCLESGEWPAYDRRVASMEIPTWAEFQWLDKREESAA